MHFSFGHIPAIRILIPFLAGIITGIILIDNGNVFYYSALILPVLLTAYFIFNYFRKRLKHVFMQGIFLHCILFFTGVILTDLKTPSHTKKYFDKYIDKSSLLYCRIIQPPEIKENSVKLIVNVFATGKENKIYKTTGKVLMYVQKDSAAIKKFKYGDIIICKNNLQQPPLPKNPFEFNYRNYLFNLGINYTAYLKSDAYLLTSQNKTHAFWKLIFNARARFENLLKQYVLDADALSVGTALILGDENYLGNEIQQVYADTGTMHILAVSGLHVAIFYFILDKIFSLLPFFKRASGKAVYIRPVLITACIWFYACISGLSPSVFRSAVMFTFLIFGRLHNRQINSYNILAASAVFLLALNPFMLTQVGFQLSYLAILGIITFQPMLTKLWFPKNEINKYIWSLLTVSIAAQLGTMPVTFYYFHQFPNYFLLSNMIAIPASFVVLMAGVLFFSVSFIPVINNLSGIFLDYSLRFLNRSVSFIDSFPYSVTKNIHVSVPESILMYIFTGFLAVYIYSKSPKYLLVILSTFFLLMLSFIRNKYIECDKSFITFYSTPQANIFSLSENKNAFIFSEDSLADTSEIYRYNIRPNFVFNGITKQQFINSKAVSMQRTKAYMYKNNYYVLQNELLFCMGKEYAYSESDINKNVDFVLIHDNPFLNIAETGKEFPNAQFIFSADNSMRAVNAWKNACIKNNIPYHDLKNDGYYQIAIKK